MPRTLRPAIDPREPVLIASCGGCKRDHLALNPLWVRAERKRRQLTLQQLADDAELSLPTVSGFESRHVTLSLDASQRLLKALDRLDVVLV